MISHINKKNKPKIVDISKKKITNREAIAVGIVKFSKIVFKKIDSYKNKKGEIKSIAIISGILGAKKTSELIPLCHNIEIENIDIDIESSKKTSSLIIKSYVKSKSKTGVEMEALTAVAISCLTIYDMCKSIDKKIIISEIKLLKKTGGKSNFNNK
tara:strand:- start:1993 stop:2460 length:468 start_codon:yes stop_codon:yes gene_type:complete